MTVTLLTRSPRSYMTVGRYVAGWGKQLAKTILWFATGKRPRFFFCGGPDAVVASLVRGLMAKGADFMIDPPESRVSDVVGVLQGVDALGWAIEAKRRGRIRLLAAGPNIVITPDECGGILLDEAIDIIVVPSPWTRDFYASFSGDMEGRIRIWAAGVSPRVYRRSRNRDIVLVFRKTVPEEIFQGVVRTLRGHNLPHRVLEYGRFTPGQYSGLLARTKFLVYLSESESQGIALHEAWMADVPTLVWDRGFMRWKQYEWHGRTAAPYMTSECGMFFKDTKSLDHELERFMRRLPDFRPREYSLAHFTDEIAAEKYLDVLRGFS